MRRAPRAIAYGVLSAMLAGAAAQAQSQQQNDAQALVNTQKPALTAGPKAGPTSDSVPGYQGQATDLQGYASDSAGLKAAGQNAAVGSDVYGMAVQGTNAPAQANINTQDDWLKNSVGVQQDPMSTANAGGTTSTGTESQDCQSKTQTSTSTSQQLYTCESKTTTTVSYASCQQTYTPNVQTYSYNCTQTYNYSTGQWVNSSGCASAQSDSNCHSAGTVCTQPTSPHVQTGSCQQGNSVSSGTTTSSGQCTNTLNVNVTVTPGQTTSNTFICTDSYNRIGIIGTPCRNQYPSCTVTYVGQRTGTYVYRDYQVTCTTTTQPTTNVSDTWVNQCTGLPSNCSIVSTTCTQAGGDRWINYTDVYRSCWQYTSTYSCSTTTSTSTPVNTCPSGASLTATGCAQYNNGVCTVTNYTWAVSTPDPAGSCAQYSTNYNCARDTGGSWSGSCPQATDKTCTSTGTTCTDGPSTKNINGSLIYEACWARTTSYSCTQTSTTDDCQPDASCVKTGDQCLDASCATVDHTYQCPQTTTTSTTTSQCTNKMCLGDSCFTLTQDQNNELPQTFAQLATMDQAGKDYAANLTIFKGTPLKCRKAVLGFLNCCKDSGWGMSLGLAQCNDDEKTLIKQQQAKATHYVGTYCSNSDFFGICLEKSMSYCSFDGPLGRIVQEAGHTQINKSWGSAKDPDCSGFTVDQFQQLDLSNVDFSDFYKDKMASLQTPDQSSTVQGIQSSLQNLYNNQIPGNAQ